MNHAGSRQGIPRESASSGVGIRGAGAPDDVDVEIGAMIDEVVRDLEGELAVM